MTIDTLARMTRDEFSNMGEKFDAFGQRLDKVDFTLKTILDVVLEIPSKKAFERLESKVQTYDVHLTSVEKRVSNK